MTVVILVGSLSMQDIVNAQKGGIQNWFLFRNPFTFLAFFIYFISSLAEVNRTPFDIPRRNRSWLPDITRNTPGCASRFSFLPSTPT